jgi:hypothetical protein
MKMNCLLTLPLPTVQPSFITITHGLIVVTLVVVVAHHHGRRGIPPSDLHSKCKPSSFPQSYSPRIGCGIRCCSSLTPSSSSVSHAMFDCCVVVILVLHRPSSIVHRQYPSSILMMSVHAHPFLTSSGLLAFLHELSCNKHLS